MSSTILRQSRQPSDGARPKWRRRSRQDRPRPLILVAEDDPHDLEIYGKILWYNGFDVVEAADGDQALERALDTRPDLVLVDLLMPGMTGFTVCRKLRERGVNAPVVALTARPEREFGRAAREAGCTAYLEKPMSPVDLLHFVEDLVGRPPPPGEDGAEA